MGKIKQFLLNRLDERSTWRAIVALLTISGIALTDVQMESIVVAGVAIGALLEAFLPDPSGRIREPADDIDYDEHDELLDPMQPEPETDADGAGGRRQSAGDAGRAAWLGH
jgi:hypothetical protein